VRSTLFDRSRGVLVDTAGYVALIDGRDVNHGAARAILHRLATERWQLVTTNFIVAETYGLVLARTRRAEAVRFLDRLDRGATVVVRVEEGDERRAREIIHQYADKDFSLTDALSFAVTERLRIGHAFTFDRHFAQYGFAVLGPDSGG